MEDWAALCAKPQSRPEVTVIEAASASAGGRIEEQSVSSCRQVGQAKCWTARPGLNIPSQEELDISTDNEGRPGRRRANLKWPATKKASNTGAGKGRDLAQIDRPVVAGGETVDSPTAIDPKRASDPKDSAA